MRKPNRRLKIYQPDPDGRRYLVSDCGRIIALEHQGANGFLLRPKNLSITKQKTGYSLVAFNGKLRLHHRVIGELFVDNPEGKLEIDHIDGDKKNNSAHNLRWVTSSENKRAFKAKKKGASSIYRGVCWHKRINKWFAHICFNKKGYSLGYFDNEEDAAKAYDAAAINQGFSTEALNFQ